MLSGRFLRSSAAAIASGTRFMSATAGKPIVCRAAVAWEPKKPLKVEQIQVSAGLHEAIAAQMLRYVYLLGLLFHA